MEFSVLSFWLVQIKRFMRRYLFRDFKLFSLSWFAFIKKILLFIPTSLEKPLCLEAL